VTTSSPGPFEIRAARPADAPALSGLLDDAHAFYEHLGYEKTSFRFQKALS
jgi:hypothetical protein